MSNNFRYYKLMTEGLSFVVSDNTSCLMYILVSVYPCRSLLSAMNSNFSWDSLSLSLPTFRVYSDLSFLPDSILHLFPDEIHALLPSLYIISNVLLSSHSTSHLHGINISAIPITNCPHSPCSILCPLQLIRITIRLEPWVRQSLLCRVSVFDTV